MKKLFVLFFCLLLLSCSKKITCEEAQLWDYPVKPDMEEWKQFQSHDEMVAACQIPKNILSCLSTERLTDLCLQKPLLHDIYAFNFLDMGLDRLFINYNGLRELFKRKDVAGNLTKRYMEKNQSLSLLEDEDISALEKGQFMISISDLVALMSRVEQKESLKEILQSLVIGYESLSLLNVEDDVKNYLFSYNFFSRAHVIIKINENNLEKIPNGRNNAVFSPHGADAETADIIDELSYQLIK